MIVDELVLALVRLLHPAAAKRADKAREIGRLEQEARQR